MTPPTLDVDACIEKLVLLDDLLADLDRHGDPSTVRGHLQDHPRR